MNKQIMAITYKITISGASHQKKKVLTALVNA